jgi:voltage-gated potassium channel
MAPSGRQTPEPQRVTSSTAPKTTRFYVVFLLVELAGLLGLRLLQIHPFLTPLLFLALPGLVLLYGPSLLVHSRSVRLLGLLWLLTASTECLWIGSLQLGLKPWSPQFNLLRLGLWLTLMLFFQWRLVLSLVRERHYSTAVVMGAAAGYLMLGYTGGISLIAIYDFAPDAFLLPPPRPGELGGVVYAPNLLAASFGALTTLGTSVINQANMTGQTVVLLISALGQLYVAILIASVLGKVKPD